jgi:hypothetical protein
MGIRVRRMGGREERMFWEIQLQVALNEVGREF